MSPKLQKVNIANDRVRETGEYVWQDLKDHFLEVRTKIRRVRDTLDLESAREDHDYMRLQLDDVDTWEQMFIGGIWRDPEKIAEIMHARKAFYEFLSPLESRTKEIELMLQQLRALREELMSGMKLIRDQISSDEVPQVRITIEIIDSSNVVDYYQEVAEGCEPARELIADVRLLINQLKSLAREHSDFIDMK